MPGSACPALISRRRATAAALVALEPSLAVEHQADVDVVGHERGLNALVRKHRTFARLARHCHIAAHHACELARDGEPEAGAAEALRGRGIGLGELLEQFRLLLGS